MEAGSEGEVMASVGERRFGSGWAVVGVALLVLELLPLAVLIEWRVGRFGVDFEYSAEGFAGGFWFFPLLWGGMLVRRDTLLDVDGTTEVDVGYRGS